MSKEGPHINRTVRDEHHGQVCEWGWNGRLWQRMVGSKNWIEVKRVHVTPKRIKLLNWLINGE